MRFFTKYTLFLSRVAAFMYCRAYIYVKYSKYVLKFLNPLLIWIKQNNLKGKLKNGWNPKAHWYSSDSAQQELANEYQHDRV